MDHRWKLLSDWMQVTCKRVGGIAGVDCEGGIRGNEREGRGINGPMIRATKVA